MTPELVIHITQRAAPTQAAWLVRLLAPVAAACRFAAPPPLEIRPTGTWGGWSSARDFALDGRVSISSKFVFWSSESVVDVVIHEWTHRLLQHLEIFGHPPAFFCLNAVFLIRSARFFDGDPLNRLSLYDIQDCPEALDDEPGWREVVLNWALPVAAELAAKDESAEELSQVVCARWASFVSEREAAQIAAQRASKAAIETAQQRAEHLAQLTESRSFWRMATGAAAGLFVFSVWLFVRFSF